MTVPAPSFQPQPLRCKCGHEWIDHMPVNVRIDLWCAWYRGVECPSCGTGSKHITFGARAGAKAELADA